MLTNRSMPEDPVVPVLVYPDLGEAVDWLCRAFGFTERWRAGGHRAQIAASATSAIALAEGSVAGSADQVMIRVADVDAHHANAVANGAEVFETPTDFPYGERQYGAVDPWGRRWVFTQSIADVAPEDWGGVSSK